MDTEKNNRILIVDDTRGIHEDFRKVLSSKPDVQDDLDWIRTEVLGDESREKDDSCFVLESAFQGQEALVKTRVALERGQPYAMAFVDIRMPPGWDGIETISQLWKVDPALEIVICSAYSDYGWEDIVRRLGKTDKLLVLKKPFESMEVTQIAHALTRKWQLQQEAISRADELESLVKARTRELEVSNQHLAREMKDRQDMESELRLAQKLEAIGQLAAGIAHEINTPMQYIGDNTHFLQTAFERLLTVVDSYQEVVDKSSSGAIASARGLDAECVLRAKNVAAKARLDFIRDRVPRALQTTIEGVANVSRIVAAMKNFSHIGSDEMVPVDLNSAIEATIVVSTNEWKYVAEIETEYEANLPLIPCFAGELNQVVLNLIVNAAHAIEDKQKRNSLTPGLIWIRTRVLGEFVEVSVRDNGSGIPIAVQDRIFDPFFSTKEVGRGTGQGLSMARTIVVDKHAGTLTFSTVPGQGTTFAMLIPLTIGEATTGISA